MKRTTNTVHHHQHQQQLAMHIAAALLKQPIYVRRKPNHCSLTLHIRKSHSQRRNARKKKLYAVVGAAFSLLLLYLVVKCTHAPIPMHQNTSSVRCLFLFINFCVKFLLYTRRRNEKENLLALASRLRECLYMLNQEKKVPSDWEMLFIDDNDSDDEWELRSLSGSNVFGNTHKQCNTRNTDSDSKYLSHSSLKWTWSIVIVYNQIFAYLILLRTFTSCTWNWCWSIM